MGLLSRGYFYAAIINLTRRLFGFFTSPSITDASIIRHGENQQNQDQEKDETAVKTPVSATASPTVFSTISVCHYATPPKRVFFSANIFIE